ncbi:hypothetical protein AB6A40_009626 [Gnathostoma spinigerum]|uniref:Uncharacterized protein n=1 Tax=Gnathostoma spinigerum TaxID=75299 RepID=A0ABD6EUY6_9BILA
MYDIILAILKFYFLQGLAFFYLFTFRVGYEWFKFYVFPGITFAMVFEFFCYGCCIGSLLMSVYNIWNAYYVEGTGKQPSLYEGMLPMFLPTVLFISSVCWAAYSPGAVADADHRVFYWTMGTVFSNITCRLIIAQMTSTRCEKSNRLLSFYCSVAAVSLSGYLSSYYELLLLRAACIIVTIAHVHYGVCLVRQLCCHFGINAFSVEYLKSRKTVENLEGNVPEKGN